MYCMTKNYGKNHQSSDYTGRHTILQEIYVGQIQLTHLVLLRRPIVPILSNQPSSESKG